MYDKAAPPTDELSRPVAKVVPKSPVLVAVTVHVPPAPEAAVARAPLLTIEVLP